MLFDGCLLLLNGFYFCLVSSSNKLKQATFDLWDVHPVLYGNSGTIPVFWTNTGAGSVVSWECLRSGGLDLE